MSAEVYDSTLLGILQTEGKIEKFLDVVMGFLFRRTDFYHVMKSQDDRLGFPPGVASQLLNQVYGKYLKLAEARNNSEDRRTIIPSRPDQKELKNKTAAEVSTRQPQNQTKTPEQLSSNPPSTEKTEAKSKTQREFQDNPESHNGAIRDGYRWAQTLTDVDLRIQVPPTVTKGRQVKVDMRRKHVKSSYSDDNGQEVILVDSDLPWEITVEESMWSLVPKECIHVNMEKVQERWWDRCLNDEPKINTREIEASVPMDQLDDASQSVVDQLMYDERQKKLGLPTSKEQKIQDTLKKAWNAEGSPFKGTEYDPSKVNISGQGN